LNAGMTTTIFFPFSIPSRYAVTSNLQQSRTL
jgi:hypothetical protein